MASDDDYRPHYYDRQGRPIDFIAFLTKLHDLGTYEKYKRVAETTIGDVWVSTVWLGLDHNFWGHGPPVIFETMVFGGPQDQLMARYSTEASALAGHDQVVAQVRDAEKMVGGVEAWLKQIARE